jgi:uncharacterized transporter YbjL
VGIGCVAGTFVGLIMVPVAGIPLTLGIGGGVLVAGLVAGWLRSMHPRRTLKLNTLLFIFHVYMRRYCNLYFGPL